MTQRRQYPNKIATVVNVKLSISRNGRASTIVAASEIVATGPIVVAKFRAGSNIVNVIE